DGADRRPHQGTPHAVAAVRGRHAHHVDGLGATARGCVPDRPRRHGRVARRGVRDGETRRLPAPHPDLREPRRQRLRSELHVRREGREAVPPGRGDLPVHARRAVRGRRGVPARRRNREVDSSGRRCNDSHGTSAGGCSPARPAPTLERGCCMATRADEQAMISEKVAPVLVARTLGPFDLIVIFVAIVLFIINSAGLQAAGPSVFVMWIVAFLTFLITGAFVTAQLGRMFPEEGSLYVWTHKVLGPFWGFFAGFVAWWPGPLTMVVIGVLVANFLQQVARFFTCNGEPCSILSSNWQIGIVVLAVLWFSATMSYLRMRVTQNYVNIQFFAYAAAIFLIGFAGVWWLLKGNPSSTSFSTGWNPFSGETLVLGIPAKL